MDSPYTVQADKNSALALDQSLLSVCILQDFTENSSVITPVILKHKPTEVKDSVSSA